LCAEALAKAWRDCGCEISHGARGERGVCFAGRSTEDSMALRHAQGDINYSFEPGFSSPRSEAGRFIPVVRAYLFNSLKALRTFNPFESTGGWGV